LQLCPQEGAEAHDHASFKMTVWRTTSMPGCWLQIKYIADPGMHSIPAVAVHPNGKWLCGQSLDNQIVTYSALDRFRINRKKVFKGHTSSGYACQVIVVRLQCVLVCGCQYCHRNMQNMQGCSAYMHSEC
jgi:hypothetical protein